MVSPILILGLAVGAGLAWAKSKGSGPVAPTTDLALIDPSEKTHPNAETARLAIVNSMTVNSVTLYEMTAKAIETQLKMPKTAGHLRTWSKTAQQGGHTIAGDDDVAQLQASAGSSPVLASLVVGAKRGGKAARLPDWLRFQATQSRLAGDPRFIDATAKVMRRMGYRQEAEIFLRSLESAQTI